MWGNPLRHAATPCNIVLIGFAYIAPEPLQAFAQAEFQFHAMVVKVDVPVTGQTVLVIVGIPLTGQLIETQQAPVGTVPGHRAVGHIQAVPSLHAVEIPIMQAHNGVPTPGDLFCAVTQRTPDLFHGPRLTAAPVNTIDIQEFVGLLDPGVAGRTGVQPLGRTALLVIEDHPASDPAVDGQGLFMFGPGP